MNNRVDVGLVTGKEYDFKVRARNDVGLGAFSPASRFMAARKSDAPAIPTKSFADQTTITVDWLAPYSGGTPITGYKVQWNLGGSGTQFFDLATVNDSTFQFTQSGLTTGEVYHFKVQALNFIGTGPDS